MMSISPLSSCHRDLLWCNTGSVIVLSSEGSISRVHSRQEVSSLKKMTCYVVAVQSPSHVRLCNPMFCNTTGFPILHHLSEFAQTHVHWVNDAIQPSHPLLSPSPPDLNLPQHQGLFQWVNSFLQVAKVLELQHQSLQQYSGLISFRMDWFGLLAVQGTLKSLLQHHSSKASIFQHSAFFMVQLSHPHMTTGKTIALTRQCFVSKVMFLFFNMLSRFVIAFLPNAF